MQDRVERPAAAALTGWGSAVHFLMALHFINFIGFAGWNALLHNYTIEMLAFGWFEAGLTQTVREIPGFLAFTAVFWLMWMREQTLAYVSLAVLGAGVILTGQVSGVTGMLIATFIMSVGFHYFETVNKSLQLQILPKAEAPALIGRVASAGAAAQFTIYGGIAAAGLLGWQVSRASYEWVYLGFGLACVVMTAASMALFGRFQGSVRQRKELILRKRYWLYYALTFMSGARRQLFLAFGGFLLVKKFGFSVLDTAKLMLVTALLNTILARQLGELVRRYGERSSMMIENIVLIGVFMGYATTDMWQVAAALFVIDGVFFTLTLAQGTYFQKIADPADVASTVSVAFTINHVAAVLIPVTFGLLGMGNPSLIFWLGAGIALCSLSLAFLVPRHPAAGHETTMKPRLAVKAAE
jgi:ABC-type multidrug transport system fused ATPase/permease subunit